MEEVTLRSRLTGDRLNPRYVEILQQLAAHQGITDPEWVLDLDDLLYVWQSQRDRRDEEAA